MRGWFVGGLVLLSPCSSEAGSPERDDEVDDAASESARAGPEPDIQQLPADLLLPNMRGVAATGLRVVREEGSAVSSSRLAWPTWGQDRWWSGRAAGASVGRARSRSGS